MVEIAFMIMIHETDLRLKLGEKPKQTHGMFEKTFLDALDDHAKQVGKSAKVSRKNLFLSSFQPV